MERGVFLQAMFQTTLFISIVTLLVALSSGFLDGILVAGNWWVRGARKCTCSLILIRRSKYGYVRKEKGGYHS